MIKLAAPGREARLPIARFLPIAAWFASLTCAPGLNRSREGRFSPFSRIAATFARQTGHFSPPFRRPPAARRADCRLYRRSVRAVGLQSGSRGAPLPPSRARSGSPQTSVLST